MSPEEKFAMCMAEAGFPVSPPWFDEAGGLRWIAPAELKAANPARYWSAAWRAQRMAGCGQMMGAACESCFVAWRLAAVDALGRPSDVSQVCEHVEVDA